MSEKSTSNVTIGQFWIANKARPKKISAKYCEGFLRRFFFVLLYSLKSKRNTSNLVIMVCNLSVIKHSYSCLPYFNFLLHLVFWFEKRWINRRQIYSPTPVLPSTTIASMSSTPSSWETLTATSSSRLKTPRRSRLKRRVRPPPLTTSS